MRVLIVDDSRSARLLLGRAFGKDGYDVIEAATGADAINKTREFKPDIITMDVAMPGMDGFETCGAIRETEEGRSIPVIFVTQKDTVKDREKGFQVGAADFISKSVPSVEKEVVHTANRILKCICAFGEFTILIIEDNPTEHQLIARILAQEGICVLPSASGSDALAKLDQHCQEVDLILTNYNLPDMNGADLCRQIRGQLGRRNLPILFVSGADRQDIILDIFKAGGTDFLRKPFVKEELLARIRLHKEQADFVRELGFRLEEHERLSKLRDEFVAMATHDLKSPLNSIISSSIVLAQEKAMSESHLSLVADIIDASKIILRLVNEVMEFSRLSQTAGEEELSPIVILPIINLAVSGHHQLALKKGVTLDLQDRFCCEPIVDGTRNAFLRIFNNLLTNAVKFTSSGGRVVVVLERSGSSVVIRVEDTGIGIPQHFLPDLFSGSSRHSRVGTAGEPGTGIGLAIVKKLTNQCGGEVAVSSTEGKGTTFTLTFPISQLEA